MKLYLLIVGLAILAVSRGADDDGKCVAASAKCKDGEKETNTCEKCSSYSADKKCGDAKCTWHQAACEDKCSHITEEADCKGDEACEFTKNCGCPANVFPVCGDGCEESGECKTLCEVFTTETLCKGGETDKKCKWDTTTTKCVDEDRTCDDADATVCNGQRGCEWKTDENKCVKIDCKDKADDQCKDFCGKSCVQKDADCSVGTCAQKVKTDCGPKEKAECDNPCHWHDAKCEANGEASCDTKDKIECCASKNNCKWQTCGTESLLVNMMIVFMLPLGALLLQ